ncbi:hypothetical protein NAT51_15470 [Flavobacterium amniphilum]|uniref:hypothetical protein n=1 Tax=Flavobacterium amniphilum TaxID=1834035 RepID=UPI00202A7ADB|nr:hypothetical protein [Flavobacterium amniphilum]MCL9806935.1 hypothetical protein [Flavobacterium amniphilum]
MKKTNYFYIDETGSISNNAPFFIHGCIKTDSPNVITDSLIKLKNDLTSSLYYENFKDSILKKGFHATANNMDIRTEFYKLLPLLDYRAYFVITKKDSPFFKQIMKQGDESDFFEFSLSKLLHDRIISNRDAKNIFYFETIQLTKRNLNTVLQSFFSKYPDYDIEFNIVGKEEENLAVVDYLNFIFDHIFTPDKLFPTMEGNFDRVAGKIAIIKILHTNTYLSRKKPLDFQINLKNIKDKY